MSLSGHFTLQRGVRYTFKFQGGAVTRVLSKSQIESRLVVQALPAISDIVIVWFPLTAQLDLVFVYGGAGEGIDGMGTRLASLLSEGFGDFSFVEAFGGDASESGSGIDVPGTVRFFQFVLAAVAITGVAYFGVQFLRTFRPPK